MKATSSISPGTAGRWGCAEHIPLTGLHRKSHPHMVFPFTSNTQFDPCDGTSSQTHQQAPCNLQLRPGQAAQNFPSCILREISPSYKIPYSYTFVLGRNSTIKYRITPEVKVFRTVWWKRARGKKTMAKRR